jgi:hypothetical protein
MLKVSDLRAIDPHSEACRLASAIDLDVVPRIFLEVTDALRRMVDESFTPGHINASDFSTLAIVQGHLVALALRTDSEEDAAVEWPVNLRLHLYFEVPKLAVGRQEASLARRILYSHDGPILHEPLAGYTVAGQTLVSLPAGESRAIEKRLEILRGKTLEANRPEPYRHGRPSMELKR